MNETKSVTGSLLFQLGDLNRLLQEYYRQEMQDLGTSPAQVYVLAVLRDQKLSMPSEIADLLMITRPSATALLDRMQRDGLIQRVADRGNRRRVWIVPTERGIEIMKRATARLHQIEAGMFTGMEEDLRLLKNKILGLRLLLKEG